MRSCGTTKQLHSPAGSKAFGLLLLLFALAGSCRATGIVQVAPFAEEGALMPETITFVNWNAEKGAHNQFPQDLEAIIECHKPDLIFLQEARADLVEPRAMGAYFASSWKYPWPDGDTIGVMTLSKVAPVRAQPVTTKWR